MLSNIIGFYNMSQQAVEKTSQSDSKITWAIIREQLNDSIHQLTRMKFEVILKQIINKNLHFKKQNHYEIGENDVKTKFSKLYEDMQEAFRKLEE